MTGLEDCNHLLEIVLIIRAQIDRAARAERVPSQRGEAFVDQAMPAMLSFRPGIREIDVQRLRGMARQQIL